MEDENKNVRISIKWTMISPLLQIVRGILTVDEFERIGGPSKTIIKCKVKCEPGVVGFSADEEGYFIYSDILEKYEDRIQDLMRSYFNGVILRDWVISWIK